MTRSYSGTRARYAWYKLMSPDLVYTSMMRSSDVSLSPRKISHGPPTAWPKEGRCASGCSQARVLRGERSLFSRIADPKERISLVLENMPPALITCVSAQFTPMGFGRKDSRLINSKGEVP